MTESRELDKLFRQAKAAFHSRNWITASDRLAEIIIIRKMALYPGAYALLVDVQKCQEAEDQFHSGLEHLSQENWTKAVEEFDKAAQNDTEHPYAQMLLEEARRQIQTRELLERANQHQQNDEWDQAVEALEGVQKLALESDSVSKGFTTVDVLKDVLQPKPAFLESVRRQLAQAWEKSELARLYRDGKWHYEQRNWRVAQRYLLSLNQEQPDYRDDVALILDEIQKQLELDALYLQAQEHERAAEWAEAVALYDQIYEKDRNYPNILQRIAHCRNMLDANPSESPSSKNVNLVRRTGLPLIAALVAVILLVIFGPEVWQQIINPGKSVVTVEFIGVVIGVLALMLAAFTCAVPSERVFEWLNRNRWRWGLVIVVILFVSLCLLGLGVVATVPPTETTVIATIPAQTVKPTLTPGPLCNGDFEDDFECWQRSEWNPTIGRDGDQCYAVLGNPDDSCDAQVGEAWITQVVKVPEVTGGISPTLSLRYRIFSFDRYDSLNVGIPGDYFEITINNTSIYRDGNLESDATCEGNPWDSTWKSPPPLDLSTYQGQEVRISFRNVSTDPYYNTWTYVDDVSIDVN